MARCTAPVHGHRTQSGRDACPACSRQEVIAATVLIHPTQILILPIHQEVVQVVEVVLVEVQNHVGLDLAPSFYTPLPKYKH